MQAAEMMTKLRKAGLPAYVADTTLPKAGADILREIVQTKGYRNDLGYVSYQIMPFGRSLVPQMHTARLAAIMGKELLLSGVPVRYVPLAGLMREVRLQSYEADYMVQRGSDVLDHLGKGYWIIPDFDDMTGHGSTALWHETLSMIESHINRGGAAILACNGGQGGTEQHTASFFALAQSFTILTVVQPK